MMAVDGKHRSDFAHSYKNQCIQDRLAEKVSPVLELNFPLGEGNTRPLVHNIRMLAFFICALLGDAREESSSGPFTVHGKITQAENSRSCTVGIAGKSIDLWLGTMDNLFPAASLMLSIVVHVKRLIG
jgi:hypothetical protein